jgi:hypothetical protein
MVDKGTLVLRVDSKTEENERNTRFVEKINKFCKDNPDPDYFRLLDDSTLVATQHGPEYIPFEPVLQDCVHMPQVTHEQVAAFSRHSERLRAIEQVPYERAKPQPKLSRLSEIFHTLEAQCASREYN